MTTYPPTVIEAAVNGMTTKELNPNVPRTVDEVVESASRCLDAGASVVHHHNDEPNYGGARRHSAEPYLAAWRRLRQTRPGLLLHPTMAGATADSTIEERYGHLADLHDAGLLPMATCDAGTLALAFPVPDDGLRSLPETFGNSAAEIDWIFRWCRERDVPLHVSIYEPGFLRLTLAHHRAGTLPPAKIQLYLGGDRMRFGLPASPSSLVCYLDMLDGTGLAWMVGVFGGDVVATGVAALAIERGGHLRVGLEDYFAPPHTPRNEELVAEVVTLCRDAGRPPATVEEAPTVLLGR